MHLFSFTSKNYIIDGNKKIMIFFGKGYIYCHYPHDILPITTVVNHLLDPELYKLTNGDNSFGLLNKGVFYIPFVKQLFYLIGGSECDGKTIL